MSCFQKIINFDKEWTEQSLVVTLIDKYKKGDRWGRNHNTSLKIKEK